MSKALKGYFLSVFTQDSLATIPEKLQVYEDEDDEKLRDVLITRPMVRGEISR